MGSTQMCQSCPQITHTQPFKKETKYCHGCRDFYTTFNDQSMKLTHSNNKYTPKNIIFLTRQKKDILWTILVFKYDFIEKSTLTEQTYSDKFVIAIPNGIFITFKNDSVHLPSTIESELWPLSQQFMSQKLTPSSILNFKNNIHGIQKIQMMLYKKMDLLTDLNRLVDKINTHKIFTKANIIALNAAINAIDKALKNTNGLTRIKVLGLQHCVMMIKDMIMKEVPCTSKYVKYTFKELVQQCTF